MKDEGLIPYSIRLKPEQVARIKQFDINFGDWARRKFDNDFMSPEEIDKDINNLQGQIEILNQRKITAINEIEKIEKIPEDELDFLLETKEILSSNPQYASGRLSLYSNKFQKPCILSRTDFFELLERAAKIKERRTNDKR